MRIFTEEFNKIPTIREFLVVSIAFHCVQYQRRALVLVMSSNGSRNLSDLHRYR